MGYVLRVRMASFFAGAATASFIGLSVLYKDYKVAHESISQQVCNRFLFILVSDPFLSILSSVEVRFCLPKSLNRYTSLA